MEMQKEGKTNIQRKNWHNSMLFKSKWIQELCAGFVVGNLQIKLLKGIFLSVRQNQNRKILGDSGNDYKLSIN